MEELLGEPGPDRLGFASLIGRTARLRHGSRIHLRVCPLWRACAFGSPGARSLRGLVRSRGVRGGSGADVRGGRESRGGGESMKWIGLAVLLLSGGCATSLPPSGQGSPAMLDGIPLVSYCDLMAAPKVYFNKEVRLRAVYRWGFEWQQVYSTRCLDGPNTWVEFAIDKGCPVTIAHEGPVKDDGSSDSKIG